MNQNFVIISTTRYMEFEFMPMLFHSSRRPVSKQFSKNMTYIVNL